jgi:hypothetical protein
MAINHDIPTGRIVKANHQGNHGAFSGAGRPNQSNLGVIEIGLLQEQDGQN